MATEGDLRRVSARYWKARKQLDVTRAELGDVVRAARADGMTLDAIAAVVGVSRQRVLQILQK
jgi:DNA-binding XRE family transcriptional regulator